MKKNFALMLCVLLLAFVLTACGNNDAADTNKDTIDTQDNGIVNDVGEGAKDVIDGAAEGAGDMIDGVEDALDPDDTNKENAGDQKNQNDNADQNAGDNTGSQDSSEKDQNKNEGGSNGTDSTTQGSTDSQSAA